MFVKNPISFFYTHIYIYVRAAAVCVRERVCFFSSVLATDQPHLIVYHNPYAKLTSFTYMCSVYTTHITSYYFVQYTDMYQIHVYSIVEANKKPNISAVYTYNINIYIYKYGKQINYTNGCLFFHPRRLKKFRSLYPRTY